MFYVILFVIIVLLIYYKLIKPTNYWKEKNVLHEPALPIVGSIKDVILRKKHLMDVMIDIYNKHPDERYVGFMQFTRPFLMIRDLELIKKITIKDFEHFPDHLAFTNIASDPLLSQSLTNLHGEEWKRMRTTLSPVFTSSKMRIMYNLITECAENFTKHFQGKGKVTIEMKDVCSRFANDVIATTAFGISIDSLKDRNNEFFKMGSGITSFDYVKSLKLFVMFFVPSIANLLQLRFFTDNVNNFFRNLIKDNIKNREEQGIVRPDMIHLLMEARKGRLKTDEKPKENEENFASVDEVPLKESSAKVTLTDDLIAAQALIFFFAGFDTVSTVSCFVAYELAIHPEIQKKLQNEIDSVSEKHNGKIPYEAVLSMKYLDQVVCETLRLWPAAIQLERICGKDFIVEPKNPNETELLIPKGSSVLIPVVGLHRDPKYFSYPDKFDPERFSDENKLKIVPGSYLPFGSGPRNCIASRFALLEMKILFFHLLAKFDVVPVKETEIPLKISPKKLNIAPKNGFQLGFEPRTRQETETKAESLTRL